MPRALVAAVVSAEVVIADGDLNATRTDTHTSAQATCDDRRHQYLVWAIMTSFPTDRRNGDEWSLGSLSSSLPADVGAGRLLTERGDLAELPPPLRPTLIPTLDDIGCVLLLQYESYYSSNGIGGYPVRVVLQ